MKHDSLRILWSFSGTNVARSLFSHRLNTLVSHKLLVLKIVHNFHIGFLVEYQLLGPQRPTNNFTNCVFVVRMNLMEIFMLLASEA